MKCDYEIISFYALLHNVIKVLNNFCDQHIVMHIAYLSFDPHI